MDRRGFLVGAAAAIAAPAIVKFSGLMKMPRVPFVQLPSGLWARVGKTVLPARAYQEGGRFFVRVEADRFLTFDNVVVGRDQNELMFSNLNQITMFNGDSLSIEASLEV